MTEPKKDIPGRIGNLNGPFAVLFKLLLLTYPFFLVSIGAWGTWVTDSVYKLNAQASIGPRFTAEHGQMMEGRITAATDQKIMVLTRDISKDLSEIRLVVSQLPKDVPPKWWEDWVREKVSDHDRRINEMSRLEQK